MRDFCASNFLAAAERSEAALCSRVPLWQKDRFFAWSAYFAVQSRSESVLQSFNFLFFVRDFNGLSL